MKNFCNNPQDSCIQETGGYTNYSVPCSPMSTLLRSSQGELPRHIDLVSIDVEENFMAVLETFPWEHTSVDVLIVEVHVSGRQSKFSVAVKKENDKTRAFLERKGFRVLLTKFDGDMVAVREACVEN
jgi:hypothetical protein